MNIKGSLRSQSELRSASGYSQAPAAFDVLLRILDKETRLLTPIAEHADRPGTTPSARAGDPCYQLTHDYLVPSIREWLARKQKASRRGRAELRLAERGALWQARPEQRQLPSLIEWLSIRLLTAPGLWTDSQRQMMRAAARKHLTGLACLAAAVLLLAGGVFLVRQQSAEERAATRGHELVRRLLDADIAKTPAIIDELADYRRWTDPRLEEVLADPTTARERQLHARLALLPVDPRHVDDLKARMLEADPIPFAIIRAALKPHRAALADELWEILESNSGDPPRQFRAAVALTDLDPSNPRWHGVEPWLARQLAQQPALLLPHWVDALRPVKDRLIQPLLAMLRDGDMPPGTSGVLAEVIADYAFDQPDVLAEAVAHAAPSSFSILLRPLQENSQQAMESLAARLDCVDTAGDVSPDDSASQRANLAIALLRLHRGERFWPLLKMSGDPRVRSYAIDRIASLGCDPDVLLPKLEEEPDDSIRAAIWLGLGHYNDASLPAARRAALTPRLKEAYYHDDSAVVHAAAHWLIGKWGRRDVPPPVQPGKISGKDKKWYVNAVGQTMVQINGPMTFVMGSRPGELGYKDAERQYTVQLDHSFDIGMTEVTVGQFRRFREQFAPEKGPDPPSPFNAVELPITRVRWYEAAAFCNWLSQMDGIPRDQWCFEPNENGKFAEGMKVVANAIGKRGYRLPTEAEWEYACRGGATTRRCYGDAIALLPRYAWYAANADGYLPVAQLLPNAYGLFDMHGNATEWCLDRFAENRDPSQLPTDADEVISADFRSVRGGSVFSQAKAIRSAKRYADRPTFENAGGFRVARTRP